MIENSLNSNKLKNWMQNRLFITDESTESENNKSTDANSKRKRSKSSLSKLYIAYGSRVYCKAKSLVTRIQSAKVKN